MRARFLSGLVVFAISAAAQTAPAPPANPQVGSAKAFYGMMKDSVLKTAEKVPEDKYAYRATDEVRSMGQILAHIADAQNFFCGTVKDGKGVSKDVEKTATTKAAITAALNESFALCDAAYAGLTDANSTDIVQFRGPKTKLGLISFNTAHGMEHYGNLVTYMRLNKIVPPSSETPPAPTAPAKKK